MSHWECGMSLVNQSTRPVKNIRIQVVLRSSKGEPIETFERIFHEKIEPGLARRPTEPYSDYLYKIPDDVKRMTAKSEFRILDFAYAD